MKQKDNANKPKEKITWKNIVFFGAEIAVLWILFHYFVFIMLVPSSSMEPTIPKDSLSLVTFLHGEKEVERGDCVVFWSDELDERLVKRVIGLPGEEISIDEKGIVYIDGQPLDEPYVKYQYAVERDFLVPEGCYLFFGDNRDNSDDARWWEDSYIPSDKLIGKVQILFWPFTAFSYLG